MKLGMTEHVDVASCVQDEVAISFEANAVAFYAQISGLAKDKIGYPIRELSTNAWDASRGNFEVHLPTGLNPVFRVRDYGPGMSPEDMKNVYARLYASTKRSSNESVGGWGLGSKSPFAYLIGADGAGSYTVTSYHGGIMRTYVLSLAAGGNPVMRMLAEMPSNEPTGMDVSFPVRREDIRTFNERANSILWSFNPRPKITPAVDWPEPVIQASGEGWTGYRRHSVPFNGPRVRMGCVMYPFDLHQIENSGFLVDSDPVLFDAPIGSLKVTLSREELAYDDTTKTTLKNLVASYEDSFINQVREKVEAATSLFHAARIFENETVNLGSTRQEAMRRVVKWQGNFLGWTIPKGDFFKTGLLSEGWKSFDKFSDLGVRMSSVADATVVIEHNPNYSFGRFTMAGLVGKKVLWVRCKRIERARVLAALGNPVVVNLDDYKVPVDKRVGRTVRKRRTMVVTEKGFDLVTQEVDMADGGYYVEATTGGGWRRRGGNDWYRCGLSAVSGWDFKDVVRTCVALNILESGQVILIKQSDQEVPDNWTPVGPAITTELQAKIDVSQFTGLHEKSLAHLDREIRSLSEAARELRSAPEDLQKFGEEIAALEISLRSESRDVTESDQAYAALKKLHVAIQKPDVACPIEAAKDKFEKLAAKYPLLRLILNNSRYYGLGDDARLQLLHYFELLKKTELVVEDEDLLDQAA